MATAPMPGVTKPLPVGICVYSEPTKQSSRKYRSQPLLVTDQGRMGVLTETGTRTGAGRTGQTIAEEPLEIQRYIYLLANIDIQFCLSS